MTLHLFPICLFLFIASYEMNAAGPYEIDQVEMVIDQVDWSPANNIAENKRAVAATLTILLGPFGGHRLYFGTKPIVPIIYVATLGGGFFILPLIDLGHILFTKDLSRYENTDRVFMWRDKLSSGDITPQ